MITAITLKKSPFSGIKLESTSNFLAQLLHVMIINLVYLILQKKTYFDVLYSLKLSISNVLVPQSGRSAAW